LSIDVLQQESGLLVQLDISTVLIYQFDGLRQVLCRRGQIIARQSEIVKKQILRFSFPLTSIANYFSNSSHLNSEINPV